MVSLMIPLYLEMDSTDEVIEELERSPSNVKFTRLCKICDHYFGAARQKSSSHRIYKTPWRGDPRVNIQEENGRGKSYQVRQIIKALRRLEMQNGN
jgi:hypothetical protein